MKKNPENFPGFFCAFRSKLLCKALFNSFFILFSNKNDNRRERFMDPQMNFCLFADGGLGETALFGIEKGGFLQFVVLK